MWNKIKQEMDTVQFLGSKSRDIDDFFTPTDLVIEMYQKMDLETFAKGKKICDPACGNGQLLIPAKMIKVLYYGMSVQDALDEIYGVDIVRQYVDMCKERLGGGHILMGNYLDPDEKLPDQTEDEYEKMKKIYKKPSLESFFA